MNRASRGPLFAVFAATGFSALALQVVWQRVISLHAGMDLIASTTVVTAFLAGLGIGNLAGGFLADRLGPRSSLLLFALANVAIAAFAWNSLWLFYDFYPGVAGVLETPLAMFGFHFASLIVPTFLMGLSLPLLARGTVATAGEIASIVGRLYAVNTAGAAIGAAVTGWWLLGNFGFETTVRIAAGLNLAAAAVVLLGWSRARGASPEAATAAPSAAARVASGGGVVPGAWFAIYGLTGAVAIAFEVVYFRLIDTILRSNSYTFASVLALYLLLFGLGAAASARQAGLAEHPDRSFLWRQYWVGASSLLGIVLLVHPPDVFGLRDFVARYFGTDGFLMGRYALRTAEDAGRLVYAHGVAPFLVMGTPVFLMGTSFPFIQAHLARRLDTLGRRTGALLAANIAGNVAGGALCGFVLVDRLGTSGTLRLLSVALLPLGWIAASRQGSPRRRWTTMALATVLVLASLLAFPSNERLWAFLHSAPVGRFDLAEDRTCATALVNHGEDTLLFINGSSQNAHPYDVFHILIGLLPALVHPQPDRGLAIGLGIGSTAYSLAQDPRVQTVDCVEICGGEKVLIGKLAERGSVPSRRLLADPRVNLHTGDGRRWLLTRPQPYDVIVVDAVRPNTAYAGNLYSVEFYKLVRRRLAEDGVFVQWVPTGRVLHSVLQVFPWVATTVVPQYHDSSFLVAANRKIALDPETLAGRLAQVDLAASFDEKQARELREFFAKAEFRRVRKPYMTAAEREPHLNRDLFPRDEYFLNNDW